MIKNMQYVFFLHDYCGLLPVLSGKFNLYCSSVLVSVIQTCIFVVGIWRRRVVEKLHVVLFFVYAAADHPTNLTVERLPREPGSFRVSWIPPASLANLTGYRIYYSGAGDSGSMDVGASTTEVSIDNRTAGVTYTITIVALSPHLPSPVIGPVTVTLGENFTFEDIVLHIMISLCDGYITFCC